MPSGTIIAWIMLKELSIMNCSMDLQKVDQIWLMTPFFDKTTDRLDKENSNAIHLDINKIFDVIPHGKILVKLGKTYFKNE